MKIIQIADLHNAEHGSDKVYHAVLIETEQGCTVDFAYGRRHSSLSRGTKTASPVPMEKAKKIFEKLVAEKMAKGYLSAPGVSGRVFAGEMAGECSSAVQSASAAVCDKIASGIYPQLLNPVEESEIEALINDPLWGAMEKMNGKRQMAHSDGSAVSGINRKGYVVPLAPSVAGSVMRIGMPVLLDGEAIGERLHCFGMLEYGGEDLRGLPYGSMYARLQEVLRDRTGDGLELVPLEITTEGKRALYNRLKEEKAEGIVFKRLDIGYSPDRPASLGPHLKHKFTESASVVVLGINDKRSVRVGVYDGSSAEPTFVGNVTIPVNHEVPNPGDVVEVEYLYAFRRGCLFQPVYKGIRDDIDHDACTSAQLKYCSAVEKAA